MSLSRQWFQSNGFGRRSLGAYRFFAIFAAFCSSPLAAAGPIEQKLAKDAKKTGE